MSISNKISNQKLDQKPDRKYKRVGILATGSELISGEIDNTNSRFIAQELTKANILVGEHICVDDQTQNLAASLEFLCSRHNAVIITGGLGPTEDDRTRFIIAEQIKQMAINNSSQQTSDNQHELIFDQASFDKIIERLNKKNIEVKDNNRRQCLFPKDSIIIANNNGTAAGFIVNVNDLIIIALPGPPTENQVMVTESVIPYLLKHNFTTEQYKLRWTVSNFPESNLSQLLDPIAKKFNIEIAYRIHRPHCDIKINLPKQQYSKQISQQIADNINKLINQ